MSEETEFRKGDLVRFMNGPLMRVLRPVDHEGDVFCLWWTNENCIQGSYFPADFLIHASIPTVVDDRHDQWRLPLPPSEPRRLNLIRRCCSLIKSLRAPSGGNVR